MSPHLKWPVEKALSQPDSVMLVAAIEDLVETEQDARKYWRLSQIRLALYERQDERVLEEP